jgi:biotin operon repressor
MPIPLRLQTRKLASAPSDLGGGGSGSAGPAGQSTTAIVRTQRAIRILRLLQSGQVWSADELAQQFSCSTRTIFRDLQLLRDCNIPIDTPQGQRGFRLGHDFFWQPERPTIDEMTALVVGARMAEDSLPKDMQRDLDAALTKLVGSERPEVRQRLSELTMRIDAPHLASQPALPELEFLPQLLAHIGGQRPVLLVLPAYDAGGELSEVELIPVRLHFDDGAWHRLGVPPAGGNEVSLPLTSIIDVAPISIEENEFEPTPPSRSRRKRATSEPLPIAQSQPAAAPQEEPANLPLSEA